MGFILFACFTSDTLLQVGGREGSMCMLYIVAAVAFCVRVRGAGANLNTMKRIVTLHWSQTNLIYIKQFI